MALLGYNDSHKKHDREILLKQVIFSESRKITVANKTLEV